MLADSVINTHVNTKYSSLAVTTLLVLLVYSVLGTWDRCSVRESLVTVEQVFPGSLPVLEQSACKHLLSTQMSEL